MPENITIQLVGILSRLSLPHHSARCPDIGIPFIFLLNSCASVLRGFGDSTHPMHAVSMSCAVNIVGDLLLGYDRRWRDAVAVNIVGDLLLTAVLGLGVIGVAAATVAAQGVLTPRRRASAKTISWSLRP